MKTSPVVILVLAFAALFAPAFLTPAQAKVEVPKYNPATETVFRGTVEEVRGRECAVSGGMGSSHVILKLNDGTTIEVRSASPEFVKTYELSPSSFACDKAADHTFPNVNRAAITEERTTRRTHRPVVLGATMLALAVAARRLLVSPAHTKTR